MKYPFLSALVLGLWAGGLAAAPVFPPPPLKFNWVDADDPAVTEIRKLGEQTVQQTGGALLNEVSRVLAAKGAVPGIAELHLKSLPLPAAAPGKLRVATIRRTSLRVRNPANQPDNADLAALLAIRTEMMDGNAPPKVLMQQIEAAEGAPAEWRVYRPIGVATQCLVCHGPAESLSPEVKAALALNYPEDKAVEYVANEWRGVIRVSIIRPTESPSSAKKIKP